MSVFALLLALASQDPSAAQEPVAIDDVVVLGRAVPPEPFDVFRALCLDANRLDGRAFRPTMVPRWAPISAPEVSLDEGEQAFVRRDGQLQMVLRIKEGLDGQIDDVQRNVCSLTLAGPHDQRSLEQGMAQALGAGGTSNHLHYDKVYPTYPGWTQLAWTAIPSRGNTRWRAYEPGHSGVSGFVVVVEPTFYRRSSYLVTELRYTDQAPGPVSHIAMTWLTRAEH